MREIRKVAVLGAGTMGARIAAHLANASIPSILLDILPEDATGQGTKDRNRIAQAGLEAALRSRPPAFFVPEAARLITVGNLEDHMPLIGDCDWIIEAVTENRGIKRELYRKASQFRKSESIISSNTSGISIRSLAEGMPDDFRNHFLGTHFFNPPRYMKLVELVPTPETSLEVVDTVGNFADRVLGKGLVLAKDTPNFIANRIGAFFTMSVLRRMVEDGFSIEEIDLLTGPVMGMPKSATFRTIDIVGLDVTDHVVQNLAEALPNDECRDLFALPDFMRKMIERGLLGEKSGQGFYRKVKPAGGGASEILTIDLDTFEYRERRKPQFASIDMARNVGEVGERVVSLFDSSGRAGDFCRKLLGDLFHYAATRIPEMSDDIPSVDNAMKWGFNWELGVFELFDAVGVEKIVAQWKKNGRPLPPLVERLVDSGGNAFYRLCKGARRVFNLATNQYKAIETPPGILLLPWLKEQKREIKKNAGASLIDLGDGVACLEFHSKMNTIGQDTVEMVHSAIDALKNGFEALVIGNQAPNFSVGANLMLLLMSIQEEDWDDVHWMVRAFQNANMALKYASKPVVAAPFGLTLGGGVEMAIHSTRIRAAAETYMGLVETGVGLLPAGGGTKEMLIRAMDAVPADEQADPFTYLKEVFLNIGMAKVSGSAAEARKLGYLSSQDSFSMNGDRQIADAKQLALDLVKLGYRAGAPREDIRVLGQDAFSRMKLGLHLMRRAERLSDYDVVVGTEIARVLSGGEFTSPQVVSEQYLLDLEREAFVSLCGQKKTQERIQHMLKKGKPLRN